MAQNRDHRCSNTCKMTQSVKYKPNGEKLADVLFDDSHVADDNLSSHLASLCQLLQCARRNNNQYRSSKSKFCRSYCKLLGFLVGDCGRRAHPDNTSQLRNWPDYKSCGDVVSHLAFANYLREFYGPEFLFGNKAFTAVCEEGTLFWNLRK